MSKDLPGIPATPAFELSDDDKTTLRDALALLIQQNQRAISKYASQPTLCDHFRANNARINQLISRLS